MLPSVLLLVTLLVREAGANKPQPGPSLGPIKAFK
uniref:Uncharacterized protein n=1 Tax=Rhodnius prolixus TaxID=13249 RepID=T1HWR8_RHOPR